MKRNWFYYFEGERAVGPLEKSDVIERIQAKKLGPYQLMICDGEEEWRPALSFPEFRDHLLNVTTSRVPNQSWVVLKRQDAGGHLAVESLGPFTSEEVRQQIQSGQVEYTDYAWKDGMHQWRRISSLKEFSPFEKPAPTPEPLIEMPPAPQIAKQVTKEEAFKKVEVVNRTPEQKKEPPIPKEATGPDLAAKPPLPPPPLPPAAPVAPPPKRPVRGSPAGVERRRLPRTAHVKVKSKAPDDVPPERRRVPRTPDEVALDKTVVIDSLQPPKEPLPAKLKSSPREETAKDSVVTKVSEIYEARITLPRNWKQILVIIILVIALYIKLFGGPDTIPLSQIPQLPTSETVAPPPQAPMPALPSSSQNAAPPVDAINDAEQTPAQDMDPNAPGDEAIRRPFPSDSRGPKPKKRKVREPTRLRAHMLIQTDGGASLQIDTDAEVTQPVLIEIFASAGQVVDRSHFYRKAKWTQGQPLSLGGELPSGYYRLHASVGSLTADERFEIGTRTKSFGDKLKQTRKQSAYEFWTERKRLYLSSQQVSRLMGSRHAAEFDRIARFQPNSFAFADLWTELKEICQLAKRLDPNAKSRLQTLQNKIAVLTVWK